MKTCQQWSTSAPILAKLLKLKITFSTTNSTLLNSYQAQTQLWSKQNKVESTQTDHCPTSKSILVTPTQLYSTEYLYIFFFKPYISYNSVFAELKIAQLKTIFIMLVIFFC